MSDSNDRTIESYNSHTDEYMEGTPLDVSGHIKEWLDISLDGVRKDAQILEIGSAFGRDADYISKLGYTVKCTDASVSFVEILRSKGYGASVLNVITDDLPQNLDRVFANAVLLHFTYDETVLVVSKIYESLNMCGKFAFSIKQGDGEEWSDRKLGAPRYFRYWQNVDIETVLTKVGFRDISIKADDGRTGNPWLMIIATK